MLRLMFNSCIGDVLITQKSLTFCATEERTLGLKFNVLGIGSVSYLEWIALA